MVGSAALPLLHLPILADDIEELRPFLLVDLAFSA